MANPPLFCRLYSDTQAYVCGKCDLLRIVMKRIGGEDSVSGLADPESGKLTYFDKGDGSFCFVERHSSIMGNIILIAHVRRLVPSLSAILKRVFPC